MEIGGLKKKDFQVWVPFGVQDEKNGAQVLIRYLTREDLQEITRKATVVAWDRRNPRESHLDATQADILIGRAAVKGWKGFTHDGNDYPYSPENCDELMKGWMEFAQFVNDVAIDLQRLQEVEAKQTVKNSSRTSGSE